MAKKVKGDVKASPLFAQIKDFIFGLIRIFKDKTLQSTEIYKKIKQLFLDFLSKQLVKAALKKLAIVGGFKAWLIAFVIEELVELGDEYLVEPLFRKLGYIKNKIDGKIVYGKIEDAKTDDDWFDAVDDA